MGPISNIPGSGTTSAPDLSDGRTDPMFIAAQKFEAGFIAEMLKSAGVGEARESFGGGAGEDGFSSFLVNLRAEKIVEGGGLGLAEAVFNALKQAEAGNGDQD